MDNQNKFFFLFFDKNIFDKKTKKLKKSIYKIKKIDIIHNERRKKGNK